MKQLRNDVLIFVLTGVWILLVEMARCQTPDFTDVSKSGPHQDTIVKALNFALAQDDPGCHQWLTLNDAVKALEGDPSDERTVLIGHAKWNNSAVALTGSSLVGFITVVNDNSGFFVPEPPKPMTEKPGETVWTNGSIEIEKSIGDYPYASPQAQVLTLLHEIGHFMQAPGIIPDAYDAAKVAHNNDLVKDKCAKTLKAAKKQKF